MSDDIDRRIASLEKELAGLRRQKLAALQSQVAVLEASLGSAEAVAPRGGRPPGKRGRKPGAGGKGWAAAISSEPQAAAGGRRKRRGRKRGKHISDEDALSMIQKVVSGAGSDGVSARQASMASGIFYPRAITIMDKHFKKRGSGKWTRYTSK
jgi:hypothetical protein